MGDDVEVGGVVGDVYELLGVDANVGIAVGLNEIVPPGVVGRSPTWSSVDFPFELRINGFEALHLQSGSLCIVIQSV